MANIVVKIDFYQWETMPKKLKDLAIEGGFNGEKAGLIAVKTIITDEEQRRRNVGEMTLEEALEQITHNSTPLFWHIDYTDDSVLFCRGVIESRNLGCIIGELRVATIPLDKILIIEKVESQESGSYLVRERLYYRGVAGVR